MDQAARQSLIARRIAACNAFDIDIDGMLALLHDDGRFENPAGGELTVATEGRDVFRALAEQSRGPFSAHRQRLSGWRFVPDRTLVDIDYRGTIAQDIPGGPTAGTVLELKERSEFGFAGDRIVFLADYS